MLPDERAFTEVVVAAMRRRRAQAIAEAVAWAAIAAAVVWVGTLATDIGAGGRLSLAAAVAVVVAAAVGLSRRQHLARRAVVRVLERAHHSSQNLIVTADELRTGALDARPAVRARVLGAAAALARNTDLARALPSTKALRVAGAAAIAWAAVAAVGTWREPLARIVPIAASRLGRTGVTGRVTVTIHPPAYTGLPAKTLIDPAQIEAVQGSALALSVDSAASVVTIDQDGVRRMPARGPDGRFVDRLELSKTGYLLVAGDKGWSRLIPAVATPDALPGVRIAAPARDLVLAGGNPRIAFDARATDDFGLQALSLQYTKVSGSGEQFEFQEGAIPLTVTRSNARDWRGSAAATLSDLNLKEGDVLVYRAEAQDARPGGGTSSSDAYFIEISRVGAAAGDAFTIPEEESRYALSQQMLIIKTERLHQRRPSMAPADVAEEALNLAVEQRMIRAEFVFMLGGEVEDEEVEAAQSTELQEGRLQNRGQRDLRAATIAMSEAGKLLTGVDTAGALKAERAAVTALQRAFSRDRYILRALASRSQLDFERRLTGNTTQAAGWRREPPPAADNRRAALLRDLLAGLDETKRLSVRPGVSGVESRLSTLAREALRIDPESRALRQVAADVQRLADTWASASGDARLRALDAAAAAVVAEATRTLAGAPAVPLAADAPLAGAFGDALAARERRQP